jgi:hypothetical protein
LLQYASIPQQGELLVRQLLQYASIFQQDELLIWQRLLTRQRLAIYRHGFSQRTVQLSPWPTLISRLKLAS